jgi:alpha-beta hydrolase superfamily lysophospholipase
VPISPRTSPSALVAVNALNRSVDITAKLGGRRTPVQGRHQTGSSLPNRTAPRRAIFPLRLRWPIVTTHTFTAPDGVEVFYRAWPASDARGAVVITHGASEHSGRYDRFARALNAGGYAAFAIDLRGHGRTGASTGAGRVGPGGGARLLDDVRELVTAARTEVAGRPVVLLGHSMGSMIVQAYAAQGADGLSAYALSGPLGVMEGGAEMTAGLQAAVDAGMAEESLDLLGGFNAAFEPARTPFDWLSRDAAEVDAYLADPMCGRGNPLTYEFALALLEVTLPAVEPSAIAEIPPIPVLLIAGEMDPVGGMGANVRTLESRLRAAGLDVTAHYYPGARHEVLNETNRGEVTADVLGWLDQTVEASCRR